MGDKYRIVERIGEGGMGIVYEAEHLELQARVALKVLQPKLVTSAHARSRVVREARLAASIQSEHSTRIHDVGVDPQVGPYIVMERLVGESADARLAAKGPIALADAATMMLQLLDALAEAHARGLVHRDLKPANLFLVDRPGEAIWTKVLDFGISKAVVSTESRRTLDTTEPNTIVGSPHYMAPEQLRGSHDIDRRSDLWACGVILHELLTTKVPFEADSLAELCASILHEPPRIELDASIPPEIGRLIERCLEKDVETRPSSVMDLADVLVPFAHDGARASLSRIAAWCQAEAASVKSQREARSVGPSSVSAFGATVVLAAGVIAFAAASLGARGASRPAAPPVAPVTQPAPRALEPVRFAAPVPTPPPSASAAPVPKPVRTTPKPALSTDLDSIQLMP